MYTSSNIEEKVKKKWCCPIEDVWKKALVMIVKKGQIPHTIPARFSGWYPPGWYGWRMNLKGLHGGNGCIGLIQ